MELLTKQVSVFESIKTLCTNYKKDGASRKTIHYLDSRLTTLEELWVDFHETHETLVQTIEDKSEINYFTANVYGKIKELYEATKENIMELMISHRKKQKKDEEEKVLTSIDFDVSGISDNANCDNTTLPTENSKLLSRQNWNFKALERAMMKINLEHLTEKWEIEDLLSNLQVKWDAIDKFHWQLEDVLKGTNLHEDYSKTFENIEQEYDNLRKQLKNKLWANKHYQQSAPKIEIPQFSGDYILWISFKDLFLETIHKNPTIPKAQKMQHLKTKLKGEAERLVQHLTISADNYDSCWDILSHRYDNRRLQFTAFMNAMHQLPVIRYPNTENLKKLHDVVTESLNGLTNMGVDTSSWGPMIVYYMTQKLDSETFNDYSKDIHNNRELPDLAEFLLFLENKFMALETAKSYQKDATSNQKPGGYQNFNKPTNKFQPTHNFNKKYTFANKSTLFRDNKEYSSAFYTTYGNCPLCDGKHVLMQCKQFTDLSIPMRNQTVAKLKVCKNCLYSHGNVTCSSTKTCKECNLKHHSLLHMAKRSYEPTRTETTSSRPQPSTFQQSSHHLTTANTEVLLTTVKIKIKAIDSTYITLRGLLDQGSQVNLITENAVQLLRLPRTKLSGTVSGVGSASGDCKGRVQLTCKSIHNDFTFETEALILKKLTNNLPNSTFERGNWPHLENLKLGDPDYNVRGSIDFLLSADVYSQILMEGFLKGNENSPVAQQTQLGWILCGKLQTFNCHVALMDLTETSKYWENEDMLQGAADINKNNYSETYYKKTTTRLPTDGQYVVKMSMLPNFEADLGKSRHIAAVSQSLQQENNSTGWDQVLPANIQKDWLKLRVEIPELKNIKIKRWIGSTEQKIQILGFCDASEKAYSCVIYTRITDKNGQPVLNLFAAKTRVAPLTQNISLPRKELCGTLLLSQLMGKAKESLPEHNITLYAWTDSKVVLAWLQGESTEWEKYVENRVKKNKQVISTKQWHYIETKKNPADCATRGVEPKKLLTFGSWWNGPAQLTTTTKPYIQENTNCLVTTDFEKQKEATLQPSENNNLINNLINKHSLLLRTKRIIACIKCFITKARTTAAKFDTAHSDNALTTYLTTGSHLQTVVKAQLRCCVLDIKCKTKIYQNMAELPRQRETLGKADTNSRPLLTSFGDHPKTRNKLKSTGKLGILTMITAFLTLVILISGLHCASTEVTEGTPSRAHITDLGRERPIYYDTIGKIQFIHDEWILLTYHNLSTYWQATKNIENYLEDVQILCKRLDQRFCASTTQQLWHEMETLNYYNNILLAPHKHLSERRRRSLIDGVGYLANSLFGVLDQRFAEKYQQDIQAIQNNENYLLKLMKNQTTIIELDNEIMKRNEANIRQQFANMNKMMNDTDVRLAKLESNIGTVMATNYFNSVSLTAHLLLTNLKNIQKILFSALLDVYKGRIDVHLLSPANLIKQLNDISGRLPKTLTFPVDNIQAEIKDIYKLLYVKARATNDYFMFEIHIPLTSDMDFMLHRAIPLPLKINSETETMKYVPISKKYLAVNFRQSTYISINEDEMKQCIQRSTNNFVCSLRLPIRNLESKEAPCEAKLLDHHTTTPCSLEEDKCKAAWIELHSTNTWLAVCCDSCLLRTVCGSDVTSYRINTSSLITLSQGCTMQYDDLSIYSHNIYNSDTKLNFYLAKPNEIDTTINNIVNTHHSLQLQLPSERERLQDVQNRLEQQKADELQLPTTITTHDIHQYAISYILLIAAAVTILAWMVKKRGWCSKTITYPASIAQTNVELQPYNSKKSSTSLEEAQPQAHISGSRATSPVPTRHQLAPLQIPLKQLDLKFNLE